jgi:adenosylmethionine-8-amino-7-oxononanoate aminotransferase
MPGRPRATPPDIQVIAKGLGGGYQPIGGILAHGRIVAALREGSGGFLHGHTYQAHPMACAAALAVQQVIAEEGAGGERAPPGRRAGIAADRAAGQPRPCRRHPRPGPVPRGRAGGDRATKAPFDPARRLHARVGAEAYARGLACYPMGGTLDGRRGDHVLLAPPYNVTRDELHMIVERFGDAVEAALAG